MSFKTRAVHKRKKDFQPGFGDTYFDQASDSQRHYVDCKATCADPSDPESDYRYLLSPETLKRLEEKEAR